MGGIGSGRKNTGKPVKHMLTNILPIGAIFDDEELKLYKELVSLYLKDFDESELTSSDMDDILDLVKNRVIEFRLMKEARTVKGNALDSIYQNIDKMKKQNDRLKENLSSRRRDRINPKKYSGKSIVDIVAAYDDKRKEELDKQVSALDEEEKTIIGKRSNYSGNKNDVDEFKSDHNSS